LILEPKQARLGRLFQSLGISFAKRVNLKLGRTGAVLLDRYHQHVLKTPTEVRRALAYVLTNQGRHSGRPGEVRVDPFSSALAFDRWRELFGRAITFEFSLWPESAIEAWHAELLAPPRTWLLASGWMRARA
jgi:hypothetical protein